MNSTKGGAKESVKPSPPPKVVWVYAAVRLRRCLPFKATLGQRLRRSDVLPKACHCQRTRIPDAFVQHVNAMHCSDLVYTSMCLCPNREHGNQ